MSRKQREKFQRPATKPEYKTKAWLEKFGWTEGKGLGKNEDGITDFIKVSQKDDKLGLGSGYQMKDFAWWDSLYTKAAKKLQIQTSDGDGEVKVVSSSKESKPTPYYGGMFVKASTMLSTTDDDYRSKVSEEELVKVCGGRVLRPTGKGKIERLDVNIPCETSSDESDSDEEREVSAKLNQSNSATTDSQPESSNESNHHVTNEESENEPKKKSKRDKKKKKKRKRSDENQEAPEHKKKRKK